MLGGMGQFFSFFVLKIEMVCSNAGVSTSGLRTFGGPQAGQ